jgi:hypothetical protein
MPLAHPDALGAEHALIGIVTEKRVAGVDRQVTRYAPQPIQLQLESLVGSDLL